MGLTQDGAIGFGPLTAPAAAGERRERTLGAQLTFGAFVGPGHRVLTETRIAASGVHTDVAPYRRAAVGERAGALGARRVDRRDLEPHARRLEQRDDGRPMDVGGIERDRVERERPEHRFKAMVWGRADGLRQEGASNALGGYTFNSLADFAAGRASSYSRTLVQPERSGAVWNAATAFVHTYAPSRFLGVMYGARSRPTDSPARRPRIRRSRRRSACARASRRRACT